ncbi:MAG: rhomboid family intramembrane serine protease [Candidatus Eremiobacterota bacterium]
MNWKKFFDILGLNGTVLQWKFLRFKENIIIFKNNFAGRFSPAPVRNRACRCGAIITPKDKICPRCERKISPYFIEVIKLFFGLDRAHAVSATALFLFLSVADFIFILTCGNSSALISPDNNTLFLAGAQITPFNGDMWRLFTAIFVHIGLAHLGFNIIALLKLGPVLEEILGFTRFFSLFLLSGLAGSVATMLFIPNCISAGASGALFGLIGMGITYFHRTRQVRIRQFFVRWAVYGFLFGMFTGSNNTAHFAGAIAGLILGLLIEDRQKRRKIDNTMWLLLSVFLGILLAGSFILLIVYIVTRNA